MNPRTSDDINELLELLDTYGVQAWVKSSQRQGAVLVVQLEYPLSKVGDLKGLALRLKNFNDLGVEGLG